MSFADVTRLYLQPSALDVDPDQARQLFLRDVQRQHGQQAAGRGKFLQQDRHDFDRRLYGQKIDAARNHQLVPEKAQRYRTPKGAAQQYLVDAILRDNAIAQYDREAPRLREEARALRQP